MTNDPREFLLMSFNAAVKAAQPDLCLPQFLPASPKGNIIVIGAGKASAAMAACVEKHYNSEVHGLVITRYGYSVHCHNIEIVEAGHPIPDLDGYNATLRLLRILASVTEDDLVLCLLSGGGSSLLTLPVEGLSLEEKQGINTMLLHSGAAIDEINIIRKHLSQVKGGRLAALCGRARLLTLVVSDVVDDDLSVIASGPTVPDLSTYSDAISVINKYDLKLPISAMKILREGKDETPKPGNYIFDNNKTEIVTSSQNSLDAAVKVAEAAGIEPIILNDYLEGEAKDIGSKMAAVVVDYKNRAPCVLLSGGELTVKVKGIGKGGPNTEFLIALAMALNGADNIFAIACDTDGTDGSGDNAGAIITPDTLKRARSLGLDPSDILNKNDAYGFFKALDDLIITGPTFTNVNDFRAIMISN
jgi:hydroxypyruvate reductase